MLRLIVSWALWPVGIAIFLTSVLYFADVQDSLSLYTTTGRTFVVALVVLLVLEFVLPYRADWTIRGDPDNWRDIAHFVLYSQVGGFAAQFLTLTVLASVLKPFRLTGLWPATSPLVVQVLLIMVLGDGLEYWLHRLSHSVPALWAVHAIHHMPVRLNMLKAGRHHVFYFLLRGLIVWLPLLLIGTPPQRIVWQIIAVLITGNIDHANIDFRIPTFMHRLLATPQFHRIHHSADSRQGNSNYGVMLPIWDVLFGTHTDPVRVEAREMGIEGDPIRHAFMTEPTSPFVLKRWKPS
jgi:sterol desaturase/sphingolipid hydroxylase (fatty acid hydroxylase superfamily)